ncbi:hypothetical protein [Microbacterium enclense]|uniref:hypothetical protein n=1 Tax=Microbacterium enclense TaxID=993073 RepID=UPI003F7E16DF
MRNTGSRAPVFVLGGVVITAFLIFIAATGHWTQWIAEPLGWAMSAGSAEPGSTQTPAQNLGVGDAAHQLSEIEATPDKRIPPFESDAQFGADSDATFTIPLSIAWSGGAWAWPQSEREAFARDPAELRGDDGGCEGARRAVSLAITYDLTLPRSDLDALAQTLQGCG